MKRVISIVLFLILALSPAYATTVTCGGPTVSVAALAANGANCAAGQAPLGVDQAGEAEGCFAVLSNVVEDTTPQLGGNLDLNTNEITVKAADFLKIGDAIDGTSAPAALAALASTNSVNTRAFDGASNEDVQFTWQVPFDFTGTTITFNVVGYVSNATAPAENEVVAFSLACVSQANSEILSTAVGTAQTSSATAPATLVQYDRLATTYSSAITPAGSIAAGETAICTLIRLAATTDTYAQDFNVAGINIKYSRALTND